MQSIKKNLWSYQIKRIKSFSFIYENIFRTAHIFFLFQKVYKAKSRNAFKRLRNLRKQIFNCNIEYLLCISRYLFVAVFK